MTSRMTSRMNEDEMSHPPPSPTAVERDPESLLSVLWSAPFPFAAGEDPDAAPGARPRTEGVRRFTVQRARQNGAWIFVMGLAFLAFFYIPLLVDPPVWWQLIIAVGLGLLIALGYVGTGLAVDLPLLGRIGYVGPSRR